MIDNGKKFNTRNATKQHPGDARPLQHSAIEIYPDDKLLLHSDAFIIVL
jgi:hypothetical protein